MKRLLLSAVIVGTALLGTSASPQSIAGDPSGGDGAALPVAFDPAGHDHDIGPSTPCVQCGSYFGWCHCALTFYCDYEAMFLRYNRADGASANPADPNAAFDYQYGFSPRITAGVVSRHGLGLRLRYFDHDHSETNANGQLGRIDTDMLDLEVFENILITSNTAIEWSVGLRRNDFAETINPHPLLGGALWTTHFEGLGLIAGLEANRAVGWGSFYARGRTALLVGDRDLFAPGAGFPHVVQNDIMPGMLELGLGWEISHTCFNGLVLTAGIGWELQHWMDYSIENPPFAPTVTPVDVGFEGGVVNFAMGY